jgi:hypothetical protein
VENNKISIQLFLNRRRQTHHSPQLYVPCHQFRTLYFSLVGPTARGLTRLDLFQSYMLMKNPPHFFDRVRMPSSRMVRANHKL